MEPDSGNRPTESEDEIYRYRDLLHWPITTFGERFVVHAGDVVCAADLPLGLAGEVQAALRLRMLDGPVIAVPGKQSRWVLLAAPTRPGPPLQPQPVPGVDLHVITNGPIALPPTATPRGPLRWVAPPSLPRPWLPPLRAIIDAVCAAVCAGAYSSGDRTSRAPTQP